MNINDLLKEYAEYRRIYEETAAVLDSLKLEIIQSMNGAETISGNEHKATYKTILGSRLDTAALKKELPDVAKRYTIITETKRFTFS